MTKVLAFGDDRSPEADRCWDWIIAHDWEGWRLEIVTADPSADMRPVEPEEAELHAWRPEEPRAAEGHGFDTVENLRASIDPRLALISRPWDLIAIGPRGSGMLKSLHLGSTADWLIREPASPVLVARQVAKVARALVAADGSAHSMRAVETLASLPWLREVTVEVVAVDDGRVDVDAAVEHSVAVLSSTGAAIETATLTGKPTKALIGRIETSQPDLVVMGVRGLGGVKRLVVGSTTAAITGSTDRSVLVAHAATREV